MISFIPFVLRWPFSGRLALRLSLLLAAGPGFIRAAAERDGPSAWAGNESPAYVGKRVAENFVARPFLWQTKERPFVFYAEVCAWYGALSLAEITGDRALTDRLVAKYAVLATPAGDRMVSRRDHVDFAVFGAVPLELFRQTKEPKFRSAGLAFADRQWADPTPDGISSQARYWIDDVYMISLLQLAAYRATGETKYLDRAALMATAYLDRLQQPDGLFFHADDSRLYWARGNGWFAAGMTELLRSLPPGHPQRARILAGYRAMMKALLSFQQSDGLWRQVIDQPDFWSETSGSAMFAFALATGVRSGWLEAATYEPAMKQAWHGLVGKLDAEGNLREICEGTNKAADVVGPGRDAQLKYYRERKRLTGDLHGQAALLWVACALQR